jgi:thiol-disulfide isomerase/thioredoxin
MNTTTRSTDAKAITALVLGIVCIVGTPCVGLPLGVPAIILGALAHRDIRRSEGMVDGTGLATAGIVLGSLGSILFTCYVGFLVYAGFHAKSSITVSSPPPAMPALPPTTAHKPVIPPGGWGRIHVTELHPSASETLRDQLAGEVKAAKAAGETVLVETIAPSCAACDEITRAMPDPALQSLLASVRIVHVDVDEYDLTASTLGFGEPDLPWFYLVDAKGGPRDGISADEWDDNDAANIAPVLDAFLNGRLRTRRKPWHHGTPL